MYKYFIKPLFILIEVYIISAVGIASDITQLTNFNILDFIKKHAPQSYYLIGAVTLILYFLLVIIEFIRNKPMQLGVLPEMKSSQLVHAKNIKNSTIIQTMKDKGE